MTALPSLASRTGSFDFAQDEAAPPSASPLILSEAAKLSAERSSACRCQRDLRSREKQRSRKIWPLLLLTAALATPATAADSPWGAVLAPSAGRMQAIGGPVSGCIAGAAALPADGAGFSAIRLSRNRFYGHRDTV